MAKKASKLAKAARKAAEQLKQKKASVNTDGEYQSFLYVCYQNA
jgi:hypothetical protein